MKQAIVLGAGIQGLCAALGLQQRGYRVALVDKAPDCLTRASFRNEGKIHMGFVYANDPSFKTSALMLRAALAFSRLLDEWTGEAVEWPSLASHPFLYVIARSSMVAPESLLQSYERLQQEYRTVLMEEGGSYLGRRPTSIWSRLPADRLRPWIDEKFSVNDVQTVEASLELEGFRKIMRGPGSVGRDGAAVLRAYIWQVLGNRREAWYATAMIGCWTLLRIAGSWTRKWAWMARRRGRLQQLAEGLLFPRGR